MINVIKNRILRQQFNKQFTLFTNQINNISPIFQCHFRTFEEILKEIILKLRIL